MIIKRLFIKNFRSYYGEKVFDFSDHLNLIIGSNGDGKSTLFDAINWVLTTKDADGSASAPLSSYISAKKVSEIAPGSSAEVKVSIDMQNNGKLRTVEKSFEVYKDLDGKTVSQNYQFVGYTTVGVSKKSCPARDILEKEGLFPAVVKKYCLFKGEAELNIFDNKKTLKDLIELFSDVKDFDPFKTFAATAESTASQAKINAQKKNDRNNKKAEELHEKITNARSVLEGYLKQQNDCKATLEDTKVKLSAVEEEMETIELVNNLQETIQKLKTEIENLVDSLDENYSIKLLDDYWILYGFQPILEEYSEKMAALSDERQVMQEEFNLELAKEKAEIEVKKKMAEEIAKLPWYIPDIQTMKKMVSAHRCRVCNTEAPEGSAPYEFMKKRLDEAIAKMNEVDEAKQLEDKPKKLFANRYIEELHQKSISLYDYGTNIKQLGKTIEEKFKDNQEIQSKINEKNGRIEDLNDKIAEIVAQSTSGEDISKYTSKWATIKAWFKNKEDASVTLKDLAKKIPDKEKEIEGLEEDYNNTIKSVEGKLFVQIYDFFKDFKHALQRAEDSSFDEFLEKLQNEANKYLELLNVDDFTGEINIFNEEGNVKLYLYDNNNKRIERPNTSLETTMHISILLAISELTKENRDNEYPLIFDAPTSTFDPGKDRSFYECLNKNVDKQCIVATKSFLKKSKNADEFILDVDELQDMNCPVYRIMKKPGFDKKDLSTIDTIIERVKD